MYLTDKDNSPLDQYVNLSIAVKNAGPAVWEPAATPSCITMGKLLHPSMPRFSPWQMQMTVPTSARCCEN